MRPWLLTEIDCSVPEGDPSCCRKLTRTLPLGSANCVMPPPVNESRTLPSETPFTVTLVRFKLLIGGFIWPLAPNVKFVPTFCQAGVAPAAVELVW